MGNKCQVWDHVCHWWVSAGFSLEAQYLNRICDCECSPDHEPVQGECEPQWVGLAVRCHTVGCVLTGISVAGLAAEPERAFAGLSAPGDCPPEGCACARVCPEERGCGGACFSPARRV